MRRTAFSMLVSICAIAFTDAPLNAAKQLVEVPTGPSISTPGAPVGRDMGVDMFYARQSQGPLWLKDDATRTAATKFAATLRNAELDGLASGSDLAMRVEAALANGDLAGDKVISDAWVRYVRALKAPAPGVTFGDPSLKPSPISAVALLSEAANAPSLADHVDQVAAVNPLYFQIREAAVKQGVNNDPHVLATLQRLRLVPAKGRAILVNAATAQLWMLEDGRPVDSMKVVVGKASSPTQLLAGTIHYVTFNPYWHILDELARRKIAPLVLKRGVSYLKAAHYETMSDWGPSAKRVDAKSVDWKAVAAGTAQVFIRQLPGSNNMMGAVKFSFENEFDIFLHDTPHKELFAKPRRYFSLGCVRLEHADRLAQWLLAGDANTASTEPEHHVQLKEGVPVYITYLTASVEGGQLAFVDDIYGLDQAPATMDSAEPSRPTSSPILQ